MDYENVFYVTPDGRNATVPFNRDHRAIVTTSPTRVVSPAIAPAWAPNSAPYFYGQQQAQTLLPAGWTAQPPGYITAPVAPMSNLSTILGGFGDVGSLANILAQVFAALLPLPVAPPPQDGGDTDQATNAAVNSSNMIRYQSALALFARRDQQILTLGSVLKELFKRPGTVA